MHNIVLTLRGGLGVWLRYLRHSARPQQQRWTSQASPEHELADHPSMSWLITYLSYVGEPLLGIAPLSSSSSSSLPSNDPSAIRCAFRCSLNFFLSLFRSIFFRCFYTKENSTNTCLIIHESSDTLNKHMQMKRSTMDSSSSS